jgi:hypothetical protein
VAVDVARPSVPAIAVGVVTGAIKVVIVVEALMVRASKFSLPYFDLAD